MIASIIVAEKIEVAIDVGKRGAVADTAADSVPRWRQRSNGPAENIKPVQYACGSEPIKISVNGVVAKICAAGQAIHLVGSYDSAGQLVNINHIYNIEVAPGDIEVARQVEVSGMEGPFGQSVSRQAVHGPQVFDAIIRIHPEKVVSVAGFHADPIDIAIFHVVTDGVHAVAVSVGKGSTGDDGGK